MLKFFKKILGYFDFLRTKPLDPPYIPFPVSFHTVDACIMSNTGKFLLGKKKLTDLQWRFPGGFMEPGETAENCVVREAMEETSLDISVDSKYHIAGPIYLGSHFIDDSRYRNSPHKITTSFFAFKIAEEGMSVAKGGDDIAIVKWFTRQELLEEIQIVDAHKALVKIALEVGGPCKV